MFFFYLDCLFVSCISVSGVVVLDFQMLLMDTCRLDGPDAKKTACYDIDVEVVSGFGLGHVAAMIMCYWMDVYTLPLCYYILK